MELHYIEDIAVVRLRGELREEAASKLVSELLDQLAAQAPRVVVSLADVEYVSSSGIGSLVRLYKDIRDRGGEMCIAAISPRLRNVFELAGVNLLFPFAEDEAQAVAQLRAKSAQAGGAS